MDIEFQKIMHVVREMPNGAMQGLAYNCSGASYEPWVRALFDYKPVGKKGHIYFTYDEIIEVYGKIMKILVRYLRILLCIPAASDLDLFFDMIQMTM